MALITSNQLVIHLCSKEIKDKFNETVDKFTVIYHPCTIFLLFCLFIL